jgi:hypothetical protein
MNTFHSNIIENQPAQKLTRESWSRLPPNAGKGCATETAKNMRAPTSGYSQARSPATTRGVNASLCVEQGPESGVSRIGKRRREGVSRGVTYSLRTASPSANTANCGRMRLPSRSAFFSTTMERPRIERLIPCDRNAPDSHPPWYLRAHRAGPGPGERLKCFPAFRDSHARTDNRPNGSEAVKEIFDALD